MSALLAGVLVSASLAAGGDQPRSYADSGDCVVLGGGTVQLSSGPHEGLEILVAEGRIRAVDASVASSWEGASCRRIGLEPGQLVTPGFVQVGGTLGLVEIGGEKATHHADAEGHAVRAAHDVADSYDPLSVSVPIARREGIVSAVVAPSGGMVAGQAAWVDLWGTTQDRAVAQRGVALSASLTGGTPAEGIRLLRELLGDARSFAADPRAYDQNRSRSLAAGRMELEALQPVLAGQRPLIVGAHRAPDIEALVRFAELENVRLIISGGTEAWLHADALAQAGIPVLLNPMTMEPAGFDRLHARPDAPALLAQTGVEVMISNQSSIHAYHLRQLAGIAVRDGMDHAAALDAISAAPARVFGMEGYGVIESGARADLVVWNGDPLELTTWATLVMIEGNLVDMSSRQQELLERYRQLPGAPLEGLVVPEAGP